MRIAFFDPYSGASGDMVLGALVDAGLPLGALRRELQKLDLEGYELRADVTQRHAITGTHVVVEVAADAPARDWREIHRLIVASGFDDHVKAASLAVFERLAQAEARIHNVPVDDIHFHEVGGVDAIVDICGACVGLSLLGIEAVFSGPPQVGQGMVKTQHGLLPIPAPATAALLADAQVPIAPPLPGAEQVRAELLTPTGAAILTTLAQFRWPGFTPSAVGYGFGTKELPWPNALRVFIGEASEHQLSGEPAGTEPSEEAEILLETNLDDLNPQFYELLLERLFAEGALDAWLTPVQMKKGRPGTVVSVIARAADRAAIEEVLIRNTTTLGVRSVPIARTKADRHFVAVTTRWGDVTVKLRGWRGRVLSVAPEYDDCAAIARANEVPLRNVWDEAYRLGEAYVGRSWESVTKATGAPGRSV